jgi:hypothetical protein
MSTRLGSVGGPGHRHLKVKCLWSVLRHALFRVALPRRGDELQVTKEVRSALTYTGWEIGLKSIDCSVDTGLRLINVNSIDL